MEPSLHIGGLKAVYALATIHEFFMHCLEILLVYHKHLYPRVLGRLMRLRMMLKLFVELFARLQSSKFDLNINVRLQTG